jgi:YidC/Oxa1 family membrane protein insertase
VNKDNNQNFFDARTISAIILVAVTFLGWQYYMQKKYPNAFKKKSATEQTAKEDKVVQDKKVADAQNPGATNPPAPIEADTKRIAKDEKTIHYESDNIAFDISSKGMGLKNFQVRKYKDRAGEVIKLGHPSLDTLPLETSLMGHDEPLDFELSKVNENVFVGHAKVGGLEVTKTIEILPDKYTLNFKVNTSGKDDRFIGLTTVLSEQVEEHAGGNILLPTLAKQEFYIETDDSHDREVFKKEDLEKSWNKVRVASVGSQYFTQSVLDKSNVMPDVKAKLVHAQKLADMKLNYTVLNRDNGLQLEYTAFMGPKSHHLLEEIDPAMARVVDFGFFNWIARHILLMLKWFYAMVGNWGVAVVLLTVCVRLVVLPFNIYSYKSMKAMQAIQPQIQALKEKYKDDQQKQQQEMMTLMRENKVNPVGGCLPAILQFPIFIALYQVLGNSIELYQAPFGLWIPDLSLKDPYYILPVLMGITMFVQQKITPNTMDPAQAKILQFMPLIFTFFMISLPSGLTLYMLVGAVFSVIQQMYFMRDKRRALA